MSELMPPRDYVRLPDMPADWKVLDIGPGAYPLERADFYLDRSAEILQPLREANQETIFANVERGLPQIKDKAFDFVWCSHVLEHVNDPAACARTISRIGKSGIMIVPSAIKEAIFNFEEPEHKWFVLPNPVDDQPPIFVRQNQRFVDRLRDEWIQQAACFLFRTGSDHDCTQEIHMKQWFRDKEPDLDIVVRWTDELKIQVIG
ncbi:MAG TPA: methyltransferase domain-containing protein [Nitrospiraceae bacterium]|jgi:SAM-dependent methyltransferase|nr:methyltransferase domain-containing protein [Nitrospiraceae bacterium]